MLNIKPFKSMFKPSTKGPIMVWALCGWFIVPQSYLMWAMLNYFINMHGLLAVCHVTIGD